MIDVLEKPETIVAVKPPEKWCNWWKNDCDELLFLPISGTFIYPWQEFRTKDIYPSREIAETRALWNLEKFLPGTKSRLKYVGPKPIE